MDILNYPELLLSVEKPGRYTGGELFSTVKDPSAVRMRVAFCFPDIYEIGMSNLGMRILTAALNELPEVYCERVYAPWVDMAEKMEQYHIPLYAMESRDPIDRFDVVAFTLQYEMCYPTVLAMMKMGNIPLLASERGEDAPILLGGGPCAYNAEPVADFFDIFSIGEGEEALPELCRLYLSMKEDGSYTKKEFLKRAARIPGFYVPSLYEITYHEDGRISAITPKDGAPERVTKRIVRDLDRSVFPVKPPLPYIETVHDRVVLETYRGCSRGCRFCQAGMIYRPVREKSVDVLCRQAKELVENTGYNEISLLSLSISDYSHIDELTDRLLSYTDQRMVNISLPSLRVDSFTEELMNKISSIRTGGITFAPEAGTQRMRDVINKNVTEEDLMRAVGIAFAGGKNSVKLYFMLGLPTETDEDLAGIAALGRSVIDRFFAIPKENRPKGGVSTTLSVACFVPKPFTPFQWEPQDTLERLSEKQEYLKSCITDRRIRYHYHDARVSRVEAVLARGDRRMSRVLLNLAEEGMLLPAWDEFFSYEAFLRAFEKAGLDMDFYACRKRSEDEILPWDMIDIGVSKAFLLREMKNAYAGKTTPACIDACSGCGATCLGGDGTWCP